jgi:hypothetical protein
LKKELKTEELGNLKYLLNEELHRTCTDGGLDASLFMGVDGRIFSSYIPTTLTGHQARFLTLIRTNLDQICAQLRNENMQLSVQIYPEGTLIISGVGKNAFIASLTSSKIEIGNISSTLKIINRGSTVIKHIFELKPLKEDIIKKYPDDIAEELRKLGTLLFKERYTYTKEYKKNMEILELVKAKLKAVLGASNIDEMITLTLNGMGVQAHSMTRQMWHLFLEKIIKEYVEPQQGQYVAEECLKTWIPEIETKLKSFV